MDRKVVLGAVVAVVVAASFVGLACSAGW